jgi:S1-C subfamily serine protease
VQPGESGGPVVDSQGGVVAMIFGGAKNGGNGFAVPVFGRASCGSEGKRAGLFRPLRRLEATTAAGTAAVKTVRNA